MSSPTLEWMQSLPKVELHAHLSGSVKEETIKRMLIEEQEAINRASGSNQVVSDESAAAALALATFPSGDRSLAACFTVFGLLHRLLDNLAAIQRVAREVVHDFASDGVVYLELRTTPRALNNEKGQTTMRQYVEAVVEALEQAQRTARTPHGDRIIVRLLLSIDRSGTLEDAKATVDLAGEFAARADGIVVGIDFSGNPANKSFKHFLPAFERARQQYGLRCSIHIGEKMNDGEDLDLALFSFKPDRIGHVVCLENRHVECLLDHPIPIEICPTSNIKTKIVRQLKEHPFGTWRKHGGRRNCNPTATHSHNSGSRNLNDHDQAQPYPMAVCTDDSGVFGVSVSSELADLAAAFSMDESEIFRLEQGAVELAFMSEEGKRRVREVFRAFRRRDQTLLRRSQPTHPIATLPSTPSQRPIAILTCQGQDDKKGGDQALLAAFAAECIPTQWVAWDEGEPPHTRDWAAYRAVIIRSTWNYHESPTTLARFLSVLSTIESQGVLLLNSFACVQWNASKRYLRELDELGVSIPPTEWIDNLAMESHEIERLLRERGWSEGVIQPQVSASGNLTMRFKLDDDSAASAPPSSPS